MEALIRNRSRPSRSPLRLDHTPDDIEVPGPEESIEDTGIRSWSTGCGQQPRELTPVVESDDSRDHEYEQGPEETENDTSGDESDEELLADDRDIGK